MQYNITYKGNGAIFLCATQGGVFQTVRLNNANKYETEWIPGFGVVRFSKSTWETFVAKSIDEKMKGVTIQHPDWTCTSYEDYLGSLGQ